MIYQKTISTVITDFAVTPKRTVLNVTKGLVYKVEIAFPPGSAGLLKVKIYDGGHQVWPSNPDEYFATEAQTISFDDTLLKLAAPFQYDIYTWNKCEKFTHEVTVRIGMVSQEIYIARFLPSVAYEQMLKVLSEETKRQEAEKEAIIKAPFTWIKEETED